MQRAKAYGIDAFALNIGTDSYTDTQLGFAYESAANNGMNVFISFDFNWYSPSNATAIGAKIASYGSRPAQLKIDGKVFVSSFSGDGLDAGTVRSASGMDLYIVPNFHPGQGDFSGLDGGFNWMGWQSNGNNKAPQNGVTVSVSDGDSNYRSTLGSKPYMARESAPFSLQYTNVDHQHYSRFAVVFDSFWK